MTMFLIRLLYFAASATLLQMVHGRPWLISSVELQACGTGSSSVAPSECLSVCAAVNQAQELCHGDPSCTCSLAPPNTLGLCLQCHISRRDGLQPRWIAATSAAHKSYSEMCSGVAPSIVEAHLPLPALSTLLSPTSIDNMTSSEHVSALSRREAVQDDDYCIYGFPIIRWRFAEPFELPPIIDDYNLYIIFFFIISVVVCVLQNRKK